MKKVISLLLTAMLLLSMLPATMAEGVEYIPAPYALDAERAGPKAYVEPVFYANGEGEPTIGVTYVGVIKADGKYFKDSNNNHELDPFEDWRLDPETRAADLLAKMSVEQKIGLSLAQMVLMPGATTYEAALDADGNVDFSKLMVVSEKVFDVAMDDPTRVNNSTAEIIAFNNRMGVVRVMSDVGAGVLYNNATNLTTEYAAAATGEPCIPFTLISNPQKFPGEPGTMGLAAAVMGDVANGGDYSLIERFADLDRQIWDAKGLDRMYGRQIDLITDPRWGRNVTTFTEDPAVMANITTALIKGYQGGTDGLQPNGVGLIVKHFPGDSASYNGFKSHYKTGQWRMYRTENAMEKYFLPGFQAAVDCKTAGIMSCYSRPMPINANQTYRGVDINSDSVATSYNATLLQTGGDGDALHRLPQGRNASPEHRPRCGFREKDDCRPRRCVVQRRQSPEAHEGQNRFRHPHCAAASSAGRGAERAARAGLPQGERRHHVAVRLRVQVRVVHHLLGDEAQRHPQALVRQDQRAEAALGGGQAASVEGNQHPLPRFPRGVLHQGLLRASAAQNAAKLDGTRRC